MKKITVTARQPDIETISVLFNNIEIIMQNKQAILNNPDFYNICINGISIGSAYTGEISLPLGVLVQLWESEPWHKNGHYTYHIGGSPLSGLCFEKCWDVKTKSFCTKRDGNFVTFARPAFRIVNKEKNSTADYPIKVPHKQKPAQSATLQDILKHIAAIKCK